MRISQLLRTIEELQAKLGNTQAKLGNTHICSRYVPAWKLKEGIRELLQNFFDACLRRCIELGFDPEHIQVKHQLCSIPGGVQYRNFWVFTYQPGPPTTILGIIQYNPELQLLTIKNPGFIAKGCLLLGGGNKEDDPRCAGKFGEGLKLAILALLRLDRAQPHATPAAAAAATATAAPPPPAAPIERQSSGEPVTAVTPVDVRAPVLVVSDYGGLPPRADPGKMTVKVITPMSKDPKSKFEKWDFWLQAAPGFPAKDGTAEKCVFFSSTPVATDVGVTVQVSGLGVRDWNAQIRNYRRLTDQTKWLIHHGKWPDRTLWRNEAGEKAVEDDHQGYLMLHPDQKGRMYVKGIHVCSGSGAPIGFDFDALSVDRDRKHVTDYWGQCKRISYMVIGVLNRIDEVKEQYAHLAGPDFQPGGGGRSALDHLWEVAFRMLRTQQMHYAHQVVKQHVADRFFRMWQLQIGEPEGVRPNGGAYTMPVGSGGRDIASKFFQEKGLSLDIQNRIYPMRTLSGPLPGVLHKSQYYKTPQQVYNALSGDFPGDSAEVTAAKRALDAALQRLKELTVNNH